MPRIQSWPGKLGESVPFVAHIAMEGVVAASKPTFADLVAPPAAQAALPATGAHANRRADLAARLTRRRRPRRGGRVVDRAALEMRSTCKRTGGSNPSLSASYRL